MARLKLGVAVLGVLLLTAAPVLAAQVAGPMFISSSPEAGEEFHSEAPEEVRITFSEPLDGSSEIKVVDECEKRIDDGNTQVEANEMAVGFKATPAGTYTVLYSASGPGGVTGENSGSFQFVVHAGKSCDGGSHGEGGHGEGGHGEGGEGGEHGEGGKGHGEGGQHGSGGGHKGGSGGGHEGSSGSHSGSSGSHSGSGSSGSHSGSSSHSASNGGHSGSGTSHSGNGKHGSEKKHGNGHGSKNRAAGSDAAVKGTELAAPGAPFAGVEGSAVLMALGAALVLGAGGGWVIRQNNLF